MNNFSFLTNETQFNSGAMNLTSDYGSEQYGYPSCSNSEDNLYDYSLDSLYEYCSPVPGYCATIPRNHSSCKLHREEYRPLYRIIGTVFQSFTLIVGVLGNILVVLVVLRSKSMKTPTNCYLVSLSIADLIVLMAAVPNEIISYFVYGDQWIWGKIMCNLFIYLQFTGINASSLSIAAFTVERYIAICHPMKAQKLCTVHRAKRIILFVWVFAVIYCSPWLRLTAAKPLCYQDLKTMETCDFAQERRSPLYIFAFLSDILLFYTFPLVLAIVLYSLMARVLFRNPFSTSNMMVTKGNIHSQHPTNNTRTHKNHPSGTAAAATTTTATTANNSTYVSSHNDATKVQVVKMLGIIVLVFATLWFPYRGLLLYNSFASERYMDLWYLLFAKTLVFMNSAINPILYNALSKKFRKNFKRLLACESRKVKNRRPHEATSASNFNATHYSVTSVRAEGAQIRPITVDL
ncbi:thyrotropin-releasing hormone receptor-like [Brevipalpus obovatus]|uniref:thyrotropin-releasing hormone receptor-like n=1 Tax=Brevipalpus obovatus TaxID=246614 RepID=UPI003D9F6D94